MKWQIRTGRSDVIARDAMVASSQPLATQAGLDILRQGGNAIDAAVAVAAVLDVVEPFSTGCGGDAFSLIHLAQSTKPLSYNGSGRSGSLVTLQDLLDKGWTEMPARGGPPVTVPGALHLWTTVIENHGAMELKTVLEPAIHYARNGFPVSPLIGSSWPNTINVMQNDEARRIFTVDGKAPEIGQTMKNKDLGDVFEQVGKEGSNIFYTGEIARSIVDTVQEYRGFLTLEDLESHKTRETEVLSVSYRDFDVYEHPPNGQGFAALQMLNIMETFDLAKLDPLGEERFHLMIEAKKLAYSDLHAHCADPDFYQAPLDDLLSKSYAKKRAGEIHLDSAMTDYSSGLSLGEDTIYLATADGEGNAVSFINSLYMGIGSGLVAPGTGIKLQNRGHLFSLDPKHPNCYAPKKLPFHTIIPGAIYKKNELLGVFGIMGGAHQAQAHAQFVSNLIDYDMTPQEAMDYPRFNHDHRTNTVGLEMGIPMLVESELIKRGHQLTHDDEVRYFGGGQAILRIHGDTWIAGSDYRKDGHAAGY
ncbi:MAG: gamma-glutamyltransferase [Candidatus Thorarchaeota archaeon]